MLKYRLYCIEDNLKITFESDVIRIVHIHLEFVIPVYCVSTMCLRITCKSRSYIVPMALIFRVPRELFHQQGTWPDHSHISLDHVDQLGQFIQ